jgi:hypothetical protein
MKIFLSYSHEDSSIALRIAQALEEEKHRVFIDRLDLEQGEVYNRRIREEIEESDGFVFLISPDSVSPGRYTLTELELAVKKWRPSSGHIFSFFARPTDHLPDYLPATTIERTDGDLPAKVVATISKSSSTDLQKQKLIAALELIQTVRSLDNGIRDHLSALSAFHLSWSADRRNDRIDKLVEFANRSALIVAVRASYNQLLPLLEWGDADPDEVSGAYLLAQSYLFHLGGPNSPTPFKSNEQMLEFFDTIRNAATEEDAVAVRRWAKDTMTVVEGALIQKVEEDCQYLLATIR